MSEETKEPETVQPDEPKTAVAVAKPTPLVVHDNSAADYLMDTAKFEHCYRIAKAMAAASLLPDHLRMTGPKGHQKVLTEIQVNANCFRVVNQSLRWKMGPFAVVDCTYVVANKLGYEGKLIAAVVNARAGLVGRLSYTFSGSGDDRTVTVSGQFRGESEPRAIDLSVKQAQTTNQMWKTDPDQKLVYSGATKWARRYCPEIVLGVLTDDDLEHIEATAGRVIPDDSIPGMMQRLEAATAEPEPAPKSEPDTVPEEAPEPPFNPPTSEEVATAETEAAAEVAAEKAASQAMLCDEYAGEFAIAKTASRVAALSTQIDIALTKGELTRPQWLALSKESEAAKGRLSEISG